MNKVLSPAELETATRIMCEAAVEQGGLVSKDMRYEGTRKGIPRYQCTALEILQEMFDLLLPKFQLIMPNFDPRYVAKQYVFWYSQDCKDLEEHIDGNDGEENMVVVFSLGAAGELAFRATPGIRSRSRWIKIVIPENSVYLFHGNTYAHKVRLLDDGKTRAVFVMFLKNQRSWPPSLSSSWECGCCASDSLLCAKCGYVW